MKKYRIKKVDYCPKFSNKVGDMVKVLLMTPEKTEKVVAIIEKIWWDEKLGTLRCDTDKVKGLFLETLQPYKEENMKEDKGNISDGYHTFNELYEYRLLYNASMFNELAKQELYDVHKSRLHSDGEYPFGDSNWFIVMAELPTGQISNHYEMKDWDLFQVPIKEKANVWDRHSPQDVANRLREFLTPKPTYPKDFDECAKIMKVQFDWHLNKDYSSSYETKLDYKIHRLKMLLICRDAYRKIEGDWKYDVNKTEDYFYIVNKCGRIVKEHYMNFNHILAFPTKEMRDAFYENFKELIEECKELL